MPEFPQHAILSAAKDPRRPYITSTPRGFFAALRMMVSESAKLPVRILDALLWVYQHTASPALSAINPHCGCRFAPTCSHYARGALREHGLFAGLALTVARLAKCGPWHPGGEDPVPPRKPSCSRILSRRGAV